MNFDTNKEQGSGSSARSLSQALWERFVDQHLRTRNARVANDNAPFECLSLRMIVLLYCSVPSDGDETTGRKAIMHAAIMALGDPDYDRVAAMIEAAIDADMATSSA